MHCLSRLPASALALGLAVVLAPAVAPALAQAESVSASRTAHVQHATLGLPESGPRACWARYSAHSGQLRNGMMEEVAFRVPCPEQVTTEFLSTLQRALAVRGYYDGAVTGRADAATRAAVQAFQREHGFNSPILTLETAQRLGLVPITITRN
jgi:hypothetical protein